LKSIPFRLDDTVDNHLSSSFRQHYPLTFEMAHQNIKKPHWDLNIHRIMARNNRESRGLGCILQ
jgi:hypothetical protein